MEWYETLQAAMDAEKKTYIEENIYTETTDEPGMFFGSAPRQFNLQIGKNEWGDIFYKVEFNEREGIFYDAMTWESGAKATEIFIHCDADMIDLTFWDNDWTTQI